MFVSNRPSLFLFSLSLPFNLSETTAITCWQAPGLRHWNHALDGAKLAEKKRKKYIDKLENFVGVLQSNEEYLWHGYNWRSAKTLTSNSGNGHRLKGLWVSCFYGSINGIENILHCKMFLNEHCYLCLTEWQKPANFFYQCLLRVDFGLSVRKTLQKAGCLIY